MTLITSSSDARVGTSGYAAAVGGWLSNTFSAAVKEKSAHQPIPSPKHDGGAGDKFAAPSTGNDESVVSCRTSRSITYVAAKPYCLCKTFHRFSLVVIPVLYSELSTERSKCMKMHEQLPRGVNDR